MKTLALTSLALAALVFLPGCETNVDARSSDRDRGHGHGHGSSTTTTSERTSVHTPVGSASQTTTTRSY